MDRLARALVEMHDAHRKLEHARMELEFAVGTARAAARADLRSAERQLLGISSHLARQVPRHLSRITQDTWDQIERRYSPDES